MNIFSEPSLPRFGLTLGGKTWKKNSTKLWQVFAQGEGGGSERTQWGEVEVEEKIEELQNQLSHCVLRMMFSENNIP